MDTERKNKVISRVELPRSMPSYCIAITFYKLAKTTLFAILETNRRHDFNILILFLPLKVYSRCQSLHAYACQITAISILDDIFGFFKIIMSGILGAF